MNGQMNNQYQQPFNNQGQMPMTQQMMGQPVQPQQPAQAVVQPVKQSKSLKETIKDLEEKNIFKVVGIIAGALMILGVFFPMITIKYGTLRESSNIWDSTTIRRFIVMILGVVVILNFVFNKLKYLSNVSAGASFMIALTSFDSWINLSASQRSHTHLSLAFFVYLLVAIMIIVLNVLENIDELLILFKGKPKEVMPVVNMNSMTQPMQQPMQQQFQQLVQPVMNQMPMSQPVGQVQPFMNNGVCTNCGAKKIGVEPFCTNCGKQF